MKKLVLTLALILCGFAISQASILTKQSVELEVGSNPVSILEHPSDGIVHIFCAGIDANGNNVYDEANDEKPSWWIYNPTGSSIEPTMVKEFDNYFVSPFKPSVDTIKGYTTVVIPFAASKTDGEYTGNGFVQGFQMKTFVPAFKEEVTNGEYLYYERQLENTISVVRVNGSDTLIVENEQNNETDKFVLDGDATDFTFVDFDENGMNEIAILVDNKILKLLNLTGSISRINEIDFSQHNVFTGYFGSLYSIGKSIYTTYGGTKAQLRIIFTDEKKYNLSIVDYSSHDYLGILKRVFYFNDDYAVITNSGYNLAVLGKGVLETHRTSTPTDFVYSNENQVYVAGTNEVFIYDFTNELNRDESFVSFGLFKYQPLDIFEFEDEFVTINLGIDFDFDGEIEEAIGDQAPTSRGFTADEMGRIKRGGFGGMNFDFPINFPLNTNISSEGEIALPSANEVHFYDVEENEITDMFDAEMYVSCAFSVLDYLVLGQRDMEENKSYIRIKKGDFIDVNTEVGANVIDCIVYQNQSGFGVVSLSEGNFGEPDAKINIIKLSTQGIGENTPIDVGTGGNSIVANADQTKAAIVMNGSHEVHILNLLTGEIDLTFSTGTTGFGGPRDAEFSGDRLYVTTYSNQIIMFDANTGDKLSSIMIDGNSEGLALKDNYLLVANMGYSNYQPSNRIFAYDIDNISNVEEAIPNEQTIRVYPHPVSNDFHLVSDDLAGTNDIAIINSQGKIVATHSGSSNGAIALNADALGLVAGNYTAIINGSRAVRFVVIK